MLYVGIFILGLIVGYIVTTIMTRKKSIGSLLANYSDPDGPYLFLGLTTDPNAIAQRKYVTLKVDVQKIDIQKDSSQN